MAQDIPPRKLSDLLVPREEAEKKVVSRIESGRKLQDIPIFLKEQLDRAKTRYEIWNSQNTKLIENIFQHPDQLAFYYRAARHFSHVVNPKLEDNIKVYRRTIQAKIEWLESILGMLPLCSERAGDTKKDPAVKSLSKKVLIIHGRDEAARQTLVRFLHDMGIEPGGFEDQADLDRTSIEKLEEHLHIGYAIIILSPEEDKLFQRQAAAPKREASKNDVFLLGYYIGRFGWEKVCILLHGDVEEPTLIGGISYIPIDKANAWRHAVANNLKAAGFEIEHEKIL